MLQVINSPFNEEQVELLNQLLPVLTETQQIWLGGYLSALQIMVKSNAYAVVRCSRSTGDCQKGYFKRSDNSYMDLRLVMGKHWLKN